MASSFSTLFVSLLLSSLFPTPLYAARSSRFRPAFDLPQQEAERLLRSFNLFPNHDINKPFEDPSSDVAPMMVERPIRFDIAGSPGLSVPEFGHYAGYYRLPNTIAARMFYYFFESRTSKSDPVVIWLTGGPGCSSQLALLYGNGPVKIGSDNGSLVWNDFGWDLASNIIFVDQPTGTGFGYSTDGNDFRRNETGVSNDLYNFLQEFFKGHPDYADHDFYITGESYAGHYIPALASRIDQGNKNNEGIHINLKGFAIGNGLTDPAIQYHAYTDFSLANKLIGQSDYDRINKMVPACEQAIKACGTDGEATCEDAFYTCTSIFLEILSVAGNINYYEIRKTCHGELCYDFSAIETFLNNETVKEALGVKGIDFVSCSIQVHRNMTNDWMRDLEVGIPALLGEGFSEAAALKVLQIMCMLLQTWCLMEGQVDDALRFKRIYGIQVLIYAGEKDLICNWLGNSRWVHTMVWSGQKEFVAAPTIPFVVDGEKAGEMKSHGPLTFLKVYEAGHMVPMDQPNAALQMLKRWLQGKFGSTRQL